MISKRAARTIRSGIMDGRRFMIAARQNPGWVSGNLRGLYGEAFSRTVLHGPKKSDRPRELFVRIENADPLLGRYAGGFLWPNDRELTPGTRVLHEGRSGAITHVHNLSLDSDLVALVEWDF